jgi:hypothetical protein
MRLDLFELRMAVEEEFGVAIEDEAAAELTTSGKLADYMIARLRRERQNTYPSQAGFYRLRSAQVNALGIPRERIRPRAPLDAFIKNEVPKNWKRCKNKKGDQGSPFLLT